MKEYLIMTMLKSKKVWYTIAAMVVPFIARSLGVDEVRTLTANDEHINSAIIHVLSATI